jgi:flagellar protein FliO/FliZ
LNASNSFPSQGAPVPDASVGLESILGVTGLVILLLGGLFAVLWLLKRYGPKAGLRFLSRGDLSLEGTLGLGPKKSVAVVRFLNKRLVLGVTEYHINLLVEADATDKAQDSGDGFAEELEKAGGK